MAFYADRHFEYDRFGNLITERRGKDHKLVTCYEYDSRHRLTRLTTPDGSVSTYTYDAFNRRLSKTVNGKLTEYVWRSNQLVAETDGKGYWQSYLYEPGSYRPMALVVGEPSRDPQDKPPAIYWYQNDHLGTPHELTDWNGNSVWKGRFSAFGQMREEWLTEDAPEINQPLRFQGQYADKESGLYYNLNRYYDLGMGRYLTADPIKLSGGLNQYQYCENPISRIDPLGLIAGLGSNSATGLYDPHVARQQLEEMHGKGNVSSTTVPRLNDKNVRLKGSKHSVTDVVFDNRGYPIFDNVSAYDTKLPSVDFNGASYKGQMRMASRDLKEAISRGEVDSSKFSSDELKRINSGSYKIPNYVWHHHQELGRMQLVPAFEHSKTGHVGGESISKGK